jgi:hypothetical protein
MECGLPPLSSSAKVRQQNDPGEARLACFHLRVVILSAAKDLSRLSLRILRLCGNPALLRFFSAFPL